MPRPSVDYSLYLVTDSGLLPKNRSLAEQVERAIRGGVTVVQLREKKLSTAEFIKRGREIHEITRKYNVPLIINDRVDVALAVDAEGLHVGWDDCDVKTARELLGPDKIIGVSITNLDELSRLHGADCDYLGVGPIYATNTKPDHDPPLGISGLRDLLQRKNFEGLPSKIPIVVIGGVNTGNLQWIKWAASGEERMSIQGPAVVSAIISSEDPEDLCLSFRKLLTAPPAFAFSQHEFKLDDAAEVYTNISSILKNVHEHKSMIHHITNDVVKNFSANVCLAAGGSPIMSENIEETADLARINGAFVLNMGTASPDAHPLFFEAIRSNNQFGNPVVFDPVGAGASKLRRSTTAVILGAGYIDVIKGNEGEIRTVAGETVEMRGVDSVDTILDDEGESSKTKALLVSTVAQRHKNIVVMTGVTDWVSDGKSVIAISGGHMLQGVVTGTGCSLGTVIATMIANNRNCKFLSVIVAIIVYNYAAMRAAEGVEGPGSWAVAFIDWLFRLSGQSGMDALFRKPEFKELGMSLEIWGRDSEGNLGESKKVRL
ncbi:TMP-TENI-domain-containing protein [Ascodesmis nigricans]|uniref:TMP-TENI-domain-containing protein n=1 Tax=Ascodesmis nigricans TaxID=341454 RepID=A0A4S2N8H6_9PEZI|nr:TMP-TENI-domain-containing protein [Ascodesmis nigricans]